MFEYDYPDVLGAITGGTRCEMETLQVAIGVFPKGVALGQPFEVLVLLQSLIDRPQEVALAVSLPRRDATGRRLSFFLPKKQLKLTLGPVEVAIVHLPAVAQPPTPPARGYPLRLKVAVQRPSGATVVRSPGAGRPPSFLSVSPFRLEVLREVEFSGESHVPGQLACRFDVIPGHVKVGLSNPSPKFEQLWTAQDYEMEQGKIEESIELAEQATFEFTRSTVFEPVEAATRVKFAAAGMPLHPGETLFIAKAITYVYEDAYQFEQDFELYDARWFQWLCSLIVREPDALERDKGELAAGELYFGALYDAVRVGLPMVELATRQRYGDAAEHRQYADKVVQAVQGNEKMDLSYVYLPLVMAGVLLNLRLKTRYENPWHSLELLEEALNGRVRLAGGRVNPILQTLTGMIEDARNLLTRSRIPRD